MVDGPMALVLRMVETEGVEQIHHHSCFLDLQIHRTEKLGQKKLPTTNLETEGLCKQQVLLVCCLVQEKIKNHQALAQDKVC